MHASPSMLAHTRMFVRIQTGRDDCRCSASAMGARKDDSMVDAQSCVKQKKTHQSVLTFFLVSERCPLGKQRCHATPVFAWYKAE